MVKLLGFDFVLHIVHVCGRFVLIENVSIAGYTVSESVYFAPPDWLPIGDSCFKESLLNCEPTVFSMQQLVWSIAHDGRSQVDVLKRTQPILQRIIDQELQLREKLRNFGVSRWEKRKSLTTEGKRRRQSSTVSNEDEDIECDVCRASLFFSRVECQMSANSVNSVTWCLLHALNKIKERSRLTQHARVIYLYDADELRQALLNIQDNIRTKSLRRTASHQHHRNITV